MNRIGALIAQEAERDGATRILGCDSADMSLEQRQQHCPPPVPGGPDGTRLKLAWPGQCFT